MLNPSVFGRRFIHESLCTAVKRSTSWKLVWDGGNALFLSLGYSVLNNDQRVIAEVFFPTCHAVLLQLQVLQRVLNHIKMYFIKTSVTEPYVFHYINIYILLNGIKLRGQEQKNLKKKV